MAAIEAPGMIARIPLIGKLSSAPLPFQSYFVFGHVSYVECGQALGNRLLFRNPRSSPAGTDGFLLGGEPAFPFAKGFSGRPVLAPMNGSRLGVETGCPSPSHRTRVEFESGTEIFNAETERQNRPICPMFAGRDHANQRHWRARL